MNQLRNFSFFSLVLRGWSNLWKECGGWVNGFIQHMHKGGVETYLSPITTKSQHSGLYTNSLQLCPIEIICGSSQFFKIDIWMNIHLSRVDLQIQCKRVNERIYQYNVKVSMSSAKSDWCTKIHWRCTCKIRALASSVGCGNSILRSNRPDRISAGSRISALFVAAITYMLQYME